MKPRNTEEYIDSFAAYKSAKLSEIREALLSAVEDYKEALKWGSPAILDKDGMILVIFAGFKDHINVVFTPSTKEAFEDQLLQFKTGKGSVQLGYDTPIPKQLLTDMINYRVSEYRERNVKWM